jgi:hypothetical protein
VNTGLFDSTAEPVEEERGPEKPDRGPSRRRTYLLSDETVLMLGDFQAQEHRRTRVKPDLSEIVDEAIREYVSARLARTDASKHTDA